MFWFNIFVFCVCIASIPLGVYFQRVEKDEHEDQQRMLKYSNICMCVCLACIVYGFCYVVYIDNTAVYR